MSDDTITTEQVQQLLTRGPYHQWLGLQVLKVERDAIEIKATWREEWVGNPDKRYTHGGILAALGGLAAHWALVSRTGRGVPTMDLPGDHRAGPWISWDGCPHASCRRAGVSRSSSRTAAVPAASSAWTTSPRARPTATP